MSHCEGRQTDQLTLECCGDDERGHLVIFSSSREGKERLTEREKERLGMEVI